MIAPQSVLSRAFKRFSHDPAVLGQRLLAICADEKYVKDEKICRSIGKLLVEGADINAKDEKGRTPLSHLAEQHRLEAAKLLIAAGADVNIPNRSRMTPLIYASLHCNLEMIKLLLDHKADAQQMSLDGLSSLEAVMINPQPFFGTELECFKLLLAHGAYLPPHKERMIYKERKHLIPGAPLALNATQMNEAFGKKDWKQLNELLDAGVHPDLPAKFGEDTPFLRAVAANDTKNMQLLIDKGADIDLVSPKTQRTALMTAALQGCVEAVELLLEKGEKADTRAAGMIFEFIRAPQSPGMTQEAFRARQSKCLRLLVDHGLPLNQQDRNDMYAEPRFFADFPDIGAAWRIGNAANLGNWNDVKKELAAGVHPDAPAGYNAQAPLLIAAIAGNLEMIDALLAAGADPDLKCKPSLIFYFSANPLQAALFEDRESAALKLMDAGGNPLSPIEDGHGVPVSHVNFYDRAMQKLVNDELVTRAPVLQRKMSVGKPLKFRQRGSA